MADSIRLWLETQKVWLRTLAASGVCHRGCAYTVLKAVARPGVCSVVYGTVHYKESFRAFDKSWA